MRRLSLVAVLLCATGLLAACQTSLAGKKPSDVTPNAVTGGPIETTALDAVPGEVAEAAPPKGAEADGTPTKAPQSDPAPTKDAAAAGTVDPAAPTEPAAVEPVADVPEPAPTPDLAETPVTPKSEMQLACEKKRGKWAKVGKGELYACVYQTKDAGKRCERESQCEGVCLARSGTCSPFKPLYGCNEILQDDGQRVTLCLD